MLEIPSIKTDTSQFAKELVYLLNNGHEDDANSYKVHDLIKHQVCGG